MDVQSIMMAKNAHRFPANLRLPEGNLLSEGTAEVYASIRAVAFESEFIPLCPIGIPLEIFRVENGTEIHRFSGIVFQSDRKLLRLVEVDDELLPGSELVYCGGLTLSGTVCLRPLPAAPKKKKLFSRREKPPAIPEPKKVFIPEMTDTLLVFLYDCEEVLEPGRIFDMSFDPPLFLPPMPVELIKNGLFGAAQPRLCRLPPLDDTDHRNLIELLSACNNAHNKLF